MITLTMQLMKPEHVDEVLEIEHLTCFSEKPLARQDFEEKNTGCLHYRVLKEDKSDEVVGYTVFFQGPEDDQANIVRLAVHPSCQRLGYGTIMISSIKRSYGRVEALIPDQEYGVMEFMHTNGFAVASLLENAGYWLFRYRRES